jgi:virginiamycin B lyase
MLGISLLILSLIVASSVMMATNIEQQLLSYAQITNQNISNSVLKEFPVSLGSHPHDVAPLANGGIVWYTAQGTGKLGSLNPNTGSRHEIALSQGSAPHGVIIGPDGAPWITDGGLNAMVRVDPVSEKVRVFPLPQNSGYANLNTATFDHHGILWFTGQSGIYGRLDPSTGKIQVFKAPSWTGAIWHYNYSRWRCLLCFTGWKLCRPYQCNNRGHQSIRSANTRPRSKKDMV